MRLDLWFWLCGAVAVLIAGGLRIRPRRGDSARRARLGELWLPMALDLLGLALLAAGLAWRTRLAGAWPGSTAADGVAMLAGGSLVILLWLLFRDYRHQNGRDKGVAGRPTVEGLALFGAGLLILLAIGAAWRNRWPALPAPAGWPLFGLRMIAASVGLGAWLPALVDATLGLWPANGHPVNEEYAHPPGLEAMRAGYPWLTAAWLLGAAWSLLAVAALWRGVPPEAWLLAAWLLGGVYLIGARRPGQLPQWALVLLTVCGTATALLQAWQTPLLAP